MTVTVVRSVLTTTPVQVHYKTGDGTAVAGTDYTSVEGDLVFQPGQTSRTFAVPVANTGIVDGDRTVLLQLSSPQNAQLGAQATAVLTIQDDGDAGTRRDAAHTLRGAAQAIGAWRVAEAAATIENQLGASAGRCDEDALTALIVAAAEARAAIPRRESGN